MNFLEWSKSSVDYGQKLVHSALEGAHEGEERISPRGVAVLIS